MGTTTRRERAEATVVGFRLVHLTRKKRLPVSGLINQQQQVSYGEPTQLWRIHYNPVCSVLTAVSRTVVPTTTSVCVLDAARADRVLEISPGKPPYTLFQPPTGGFDRRENPRQLRTSRDISSFFLTLAFALAVDALVAETSRHRREQGLLPVIMRSARVCAVLFQPPFLAPVSGLRPFQFEAASGHGAISRRVLPSLVLSGGGVVFSWATCCAMEAGLGPFPRLSRANQDIIRRGFGSPSCSVGDPL